MEPDRGCEMAAVCRRGLARWGRDVGVAMEEVVETCLLGGTLKVAERVTCGLLTVGCRQNN